MDTKLKKWHNFDMLLYLQDDQSKETGLAIFLKLVPKVLDR